MWFSVCLFLKNKLVLLYCLVFLCSSTEEIKVGVDKAVKEVVDPIKTSVSS